MIAVAMLAALFKIAWMFVYQHHESARLWCGTAITGKYGKPQIGERLRFRVYCLDAAINLAICQVFGQDFITAIRLGGGYQQRIVELESVTSIFALWIGVRQSDAHRSFQPTHRALPSILQLHACASFPHRWNQLRIAQGLYSGFRRKPSLPALRREANQLLWTCLIPPVLSSC